MIHVFPWAGFFRKFNLSFMKQFFILKTYILHCSMKFCSKAFRQQPIKYMVAPRKYNASVVEFDGSGQPPPMMPSSQDY